MRSVLVPLDGSDLAAAILPDARRLAGPDGELILMREVTIASSSEPAGPPGQQETVEAARVYLETVAQVLRTEGVQVRTQPLRAGDPAVAIDEGVELLRADMIAWFTHGRSQEERWRTGSVVWRALLRSTVPVLLRYVDPERPFARRPQRHPRRIVVPLDGSALAEGALPLAQELAAEWSAEVWLVRVATPSLPAADDSPGGGNAQDVRDYLEGIARTMTGEIQTQVSSGPVEETLVRVVEDLDPTAVVMTSHGRTGVSRAMVGSVMNSLVHNLRCPIVGRSIRRSRRSGATRKFSPTTFWRSQTSRHVLPHYANRPAIDRSCRAIASSRTMRSAVGGCV